MNELADEMRDEKLRGKLIRSVIEDRVVLAAWIVEFSTTAPMPGHEDTTGIL